LVAQASPVRSERRGLGRMYVPAAAYLLTLSLLVWGVLEIAFSWGRQ
jgi:hypothetical protein